MNEAQGLCGRPATFYVARACPAPARPAEADGRPTVRAA